MRLVRKLAVVGWLVSAVSAQEAPLIWVEGESAQRSETHRNAWFDSVAPDELAGGAQIANFSEPGQPEGWAEYDVDLPTGGAWRLWLRANPCSGLLYRWDGGAEQTLDAKALQDEDNRNRRRADYQPRVRQAFNVALDGNHDARTMTWYDLGTVALAQGRHTLRLSLGGRKDDKRFAALDCFVLTQAAFTPNHQYKPGEQPKGLFSYTAEQTWAFEPQRDAFAADALLDLRVLNEQVAGEHGFIKLSADGNDFVRGDGQPIRFWGGSDYVQRLAYERKDQAPLEHHARFLAKRGVNVVRLHGAVQPDRAGAKLTDVNEKELDEIYRLVAAMKTAGIYTIISPYWGVHAKAQPDWGVADAGTGNCTAQVFFDPALQQGYKAWLKRIYADPNPYTGLPLGKDPAVATIQIQNEDSMLFWTMQGVKGPALDMLRLRYGKWVRQRYGTFERAMVAWGGYKADDDDFGGGRPGMFIVWEFTRDARNKKGNDAGREQRLADQLEFMAGVMYDFNREIARYLREDLGCRQLVNAGNWRTADQVILDDAERWSYTANEVIAKNHYFGGLHRGINVGWQILPGQVFTDRSFAKDPVGSPLSVRQVAGHPFLVTESLWVPPMSTAAEGPLVVAAQSCLTGLDTFYWFANGAEEWERPMNKWTYALPTTLGQFPAAALIFRQGLVKPGAVVVHEERSPRSVWRRALPLIAEEGAWDPNRDKPDQPTVKAESPVDPLAFLVGRVEVRYTDKPGANRVADLKPYIDTAKQTVRSTTGEIVTDLAAGVYRVNAPRAQGAAGYLGKAGPQTLADTVIDCRNEFASVVVVPLDGQPLAKSAKVLVQAGTVVRPTGWTERRTSIQDGEKMVAGSRIVSVGSAPWRVEKTQASVTLRNAVLTSATVLDANGNAAGTVPLEKVAGGVKLSLPPDALYVVLR